MKNILSRILIMGSLSTLVACGGGGSTPPPADTSSINLINASSVIVTADTAGLADGISTACYYSNDDSAYIQETTSVVGTVASYAQKHFSDDICTNLTTTLSFKADVLVGQDIDITGWIDGMRDPLATPPSKASDSSVALPVTPKYTKLDLTISQTSYPGISINDTTSLGFVIDDSSTEGVVLYRVDESGNASDADPYTNIPATPSGGTGGGTTIGANIKVNIDSVVTTGLSTTLLTYTVTNTGDTATGDFDVMAWYHRATAPVYGDAQSGSFNIHNLAAGASQQSSITIGVTLLTGMTLDAYLIADFSESVGETDEGLTGINDNLAKKTWTVSDLFNFLNTDFIESTQVSIKSVYDPSTDRTAISMRDANGSPALTIALVGEVTGPGTYRLSDATVFSTTYSASTSTYVINNSTPTDTPVTVTITSAGGVGEAIYGSYDATLCTIGGSGTCSNTTRYTGSFYIIRDANL